ncbi:MAG: hypothetical protein GY793_00140, partial [Proteobacteria bacterium]|nr:hypothetical protein [Pseudomonadota bacterium]
MKYKDCLKILFLILCAFFISCGQKHDCDKDDIYTANIEFGRVINQIPQNELDSIISSLPYWKLSDFKTTDFHESIAIEILRTDFQTKGLKANEFLIYEIKKENDSILVFYLDHFDSFVYRYNLNKLNLDLSKKLAVDGFIEEVPPMTGNISGYEG